METDASTILYNLLLNLQWAFIGVTFVLIVYDAVEFVRTRYKRYISYAGGRLGFAIMVGVIGVLLARSPVHAIPATPELALWIGGLVLMGQSLITRTWEIREARKNREA